MPGKFLGRAFVHFFIILAKPLSIGFISNGLNVSFKVQTSSWCFLFFALSDRCFWVEDVFMFTLSRIAILSFTWILMVLTHLFAFTILVL